MDIIYVRLKPVLYPNTKTVTLISGTHYILKFNNYLDSSINNRIYFTLIYTID